MMAPKEELLKYFLFIFITYEFLFLTIFRQIGRGCVFRSLNVALRVFMYVNKHQNKDQKKRKKLELLEIF